MLKSEKECVVLETNEIFLLREIERVQHEKKRKTDIGKREGGGEWEKRRLMI